jgi:peptidoglycan hydrolase-like protein with peptidoglycan-binding domain
MVLNRRFEFEPFDFETEFAGTELERLIAELDDQQQTELAPGSCPDVPVPASRRPRVLVRGSVHSAVREIQRKLNAFHAYQVAAGLPGLRDAPLVEDCIFGKNTYTAVKSFQELVFPGLPAEHDGKVGPHTWGQLDAIALGPGPGRVARLTVEQLRVTDDSFVVPLNWNQVIGLDTAALNLELTASGLPPATMPSLIGVELLSRPPNRAVGAATLGAAARFEALRFRPDPAVPNRIVYRFSLPLNSIGAFLKVERSLKEMATVVRNGGTSDAEFRAALGWNIRGIATQPVAAGTTTGSESGEIPDAFALFRAAGVEVLDVKVPAQLNWHVPGTVKRLVRSPADVVYYSGHGLSSSGKLAIDTENKPCGETGAYSNWLGPADLTRVWTSPMDLDVLILAGCSVLRIDFSTSPPSGPGVAWSRLLSGRGGPLVALLGYRGSAPCDNPSGNRIAKRMAQRMALGSTTFARDWLEVNGDNNANNAVAMDGRGYWWIEGTFFGGYDIKGPIPFS